MLYDNFRNYSLVPDNNDNDNNDNNDNNNH